MAIKNHIPSPSQRGIALLVAIILSAVVLSVALSLLEIAYKQVVLSISSKQSQYAFDFADSTMECALYYDQQKDAFDYTATPYLTNGSIVCTGGSIVPTAAPNSSVVSGNTRTTTIYVQCNGINYDNGLQGIATIVKTTGGTTCNGTDTTCIYATGYSTCNASDPRRIERGLRVTYAGSSGSGGGGGGGGAGAEIIPVSFSATSNYLNHYSGLTTSGAMRDGNYGATSADDWSVHGTNIGTNQAITADLGSSQAIGSVTLADIAQANPDGWGPAETNGAIIEGSIDGSTYTRLGTVSGVLDVTPKTFAVSGTYRYIRVRMPINNYFGLGDFRIYAP